MTIGNGDVGAMWQGKGGGAEEKGVKFDEPSIDFVMQAGSSLGHAGACVRYGTQ